MKVGVQISYVYAPLVMQCYTNAKIVETMEAWILLHQQSGKKPVNERDCYFFMNDSKKSGIFNKTNETFRNVNPKRVEWLNSRVGIT